MLFDPISRDVAVCHHISDDVLLGDEFSIYKRKFFGSMRRHLERKAILSHILC